MKRKKVLFLSNYSFICLLQIDLTHNDVLFFKCVSWHDSTGDKRRIELSRKLRKLNQFLPLSVATEISTYSRNPLIGVRF